MILKGHWDKEEVLKWPINEEKRAERHGRIRGGGPKHESGSLYLIRIAQ